MTEGGRGRGFWVGFRGGGGRGEGFRQLGRSPARGGVGEVAGIEKGRGWGFWVGFRGGGGKGEGFRQLGRSPARGGVGEVAGIEKGRGWGFWVGFRGGGGKGEGFRQLGRSPARGGVGEVAGIEKGRGWGFWVGFRGGGGKGEGFRQLGRSPARGGVGEVAGIEKSRLLSPHFLQPLQLMLVQTEVLGKAPFKEVASLWGARADLKKLQNTIRMIQARVHDTERHQEVDDSDAVKEWLQRLEMLLYQVDDLFDLVLTIDCQKQRIELNKQRRGTGRRVAGTEG
uniref:Disease resistance N-terminal domain-containing protein n=1 Tax=Chenopodium quinoa TaxID=63459 RepID=A0A803NCQ8_CHEQI